MKPPVFDYHDPETVEEALDLLAEHGDEGKLLAGGQSLVPLLNFRLARPENLIDLNRLGSLTGIRREHGSLQIGAMTRQSTMEHSALVAENWPLLTEALSYVAHAQIRNRGTIGGSVAHADPAAELPVAFSALDSRVRVRSARAERTIEISDLFVTHLTTTLEPDELLVGIEVDPVPERTGHAFVEFARRHGDFALGGAAVLLTLDSSGSCERAAIALLGAAPIPVRATDAEQALVGAAIDEKAIAAAADAAIADISPTGDIHGSAEYRRDLCRVMVRRAIAAANRRAKGEPEPESSNGVID
ncbi:MAG: xanthine dehydrogenase family protein subunit M [Solirubrobacterales bacterium]|nr:xanthine dehydrogenase family protein subunit M [Solirubrobacterales bacterium]